MNRHCRIAAFSLIEIMFAMAIAIVAMSIAVSSYDRYQSKIRYLDGHNKMLEIMQRQHRYFAEHLTYTDRLELLGFTPDDHAVLSDQRHFSIRAAACRNALDQCVRLTAAATNGDADFLTLDSDGQRTAPAHW